MQTRLMKNKLLYLLVLAILPLVLVAHPLQVGIFDIYQIDGQLNLKMKIDHGDIMDALESQYQYSSSLLNDSELQRCLQDCFESNISLSINDGYAKLHHYEFEFGEEVVYVSTKIDTNHSKISKIAITNTILIE